MFNNAIVVMSRFEDEYLLEWILYHKLIGIEHIFYYDNGNLEPEQNITKQILQPFIDDNFITYIPWGQYNGTKYEFTDPHLIKHNDSKHLMWCAFDKTIKMKPSKWLIGIDMDEFIVLDPKYENMNTFLENKDNYKAIFMKAVELGTSKHILPKYNLVTEHYNLASHQKMEPWKSIVNTSLHNYCGGVHSWGMSEDNIFKQDDVTVNHYICKSEYEFTRKRIERKLSVDEIVFDNLYSGNFESHVKQHEFTSNINKFKNYNTFCDKMYKYIPSIKSEINKYYYGNSYTPSSISINQVIDYLNHNKIEYFIINNSLLGAFRNNYLLPHDQFLDICVSKNHYNDIDELKDISIISYYHVYDNTVHIGNSSFTYKLQKDVVFPINKIKLNNTMVQCPVNIYKFLLMTGYRISN
jgi:hypothetical protein